jgi:hypothetical protein
MTSLRDHPIAGAGLLLGPAISIGGLVVHLFAPHQMRLPLEVWEIVGFGIFFGSAIRLLSGGARSKSIWSDQPRSRRRRAGVSAGLAGGLDEEFTTESPNHLMRLVRDTSNTERERVTAPYVGKWIRISATTRDVSRNDHELTVWTAKPNLILEFEPPWDNRLDGLHHGQRITATGRIARIASYQVELDTCRLLTIRS